MTYEFAAYLHSPVRCRCFRYDHWKNKGEACPSAQSSCSQGNQSLRRLIGLEKRVAAADIDHYNAKRASAIRAWGRLLD